MDVFIVLKN